MCYPPSGYIIFSLRIIRFCGDRGLEAGNQNEGQGRDNPNTQKRLINSRTCAPDEYY